MTVQFFEVGGCVRDELMGRPAKDIDFTVVAPSFEAMEQVVADAGMKVVQRKPEFGIVLAVAKQPFRGHTGGLDFVWARKDGPSSDGRRPDWTEPGTLMDDLARRDFTMNAIAKDQDFHMLDPFGGQADIKDRLIRCVGEAEDRIFEDALRGLRALRFSITLGFRIDQDIQDILRSARFAEALSSVSKERQREEMEKMFAKDTIASMLLLNQFPLVMAAVFSNGLRLMPTMKGK